MKLTDAQKENFSSLQQAIMNGDASLVPCEEVSTGKVVPVICIAQRESNGDCEIEPVARMFTYEEGDDPNELFKNPVEAV